MERENKMIEHLKGIEIISVDLVTEIRVCLTNEDHMY